MIVDKIRNKLASDVAKFNASIQGVLVDGEQKGIPPLFLDRINNLVSDLKTDMKDLDILFKEEIKNNPQEETNY